MMDHLDSTDWDQLEDAKELGTDDRFGENVVGDETEEEKDDDEDTEEAMEVVSFFTSPFNHFQRFVISSLLCLIVSSTA